MLCDGHLVALSFFTCLHVCLFAPLSVRQEVGLWVYLSNHIVTGLNDPSCLLTRISLAAEKSALIVTMLLGVIQR